MKRALATVMMAGIIGLTAAAAAAPECTGWMKQEDGTEWRTCVGDDGKQYCEQRKDNVITRVDCHKR